MKCSLCSAEATIHLTEIVNNEMIEVHLCESCAQDKGTTFKAHFNFGDLTGEFSDLIGLPPSQKKGKEALSCPQCGICYEEFAKGGRLGCSDCYAAFQKILNPLIKRVQKGATHIGKKPAKISTTTRSQHDLRLLQERLRKCVQAEAFEEAAKLRDQIKKIQSKGKSKKAGS